MKHPIHPIRIPRCSWCRRIGCENPWHGIDRSVAPPIVQCVTDLGETIEAALLLTQPTRNGRARLG